MYTCDSILLYFMVRIAFLNNCFYCFPGVIKMKLQVLWAARNVFIKTIITGEGLFIKQGGGAFFFNVLCKYVPHDCLIRLNTLGPEQCLCLSVLKKHRKLNTEGFFYDEKHCKKKKKTNKPEKKSLQEELHNWKEVWLERPMLSTCLVAAVFSLATIRQ